MGMQHLSKGSAMVCLPVNEAVNVVASIQDCS